MAVISNMAIRRYIRRILFILVCIFIVYLIFSPYNKFVTGDADRLNKAVVTIYNESNLNNKCVIEVRKKPDVKKLYSIIKKTAQLKIHRYPRHSIVTSVNPKYEIYFFYNNGKVDKFATPENPQYVYRAFDNSENGYIMGKNNELLNYVIKLAHKKE